MFKQNRATGSLYGGGALYMNGGYMDTYLCSFVNNAAATTYGQTLYISSGMFGLAYATITSSSTKVSHWSNQSASSTCQTYLYQHCHGERGYAQRGVIRSASPTDVGLCVFLLDGRAPTRRVTRTSTSRLGQ